MSTIINRPAGADLFLGFESLATVLSEEDELAIGGGDRSRSRSRSGRRRGRRRRRRRGRRGARTT